MSDVNMILAAVLALIAVGDVVIAQAMGAKLPSQLRVMLHIGALLMLVGAGLLASGAIRLVG